jgi:hypothetical protein
LKRQSEADRRKSMAEITRAADIESRPYRANEGLPSDPHPARERSLPAQSQQHFLALMSTAFMCVQFRAEGRKRTTKAIDQLRATSGN